MSANGTFHQHLIEELRILIRGGDFAPRAQFLTEREIAERFKTSRPTANKALSSLVSQGLLEVRRGAGTFVRESVLDYDLERLVSFTDKALAAGKKPGTMLLDYRKIPAAEAPPIIAQSLKARGDAPLIYMERIRLADGKPVIYERRHVVASLCPKMTRTDAKSSLYGCWTAKCGLEISGADEVIHAVNASKAQAAHLQIPVGTACFEIVATGFANDDQPLWQETTLYRADVYEFRNRISGLIASHSAMGRIKG
ncbi:MAG: GntR family transcriptional regulator [Prosthecobacter sp.]